MADVLQHTSQFDASPLVRHFITHTPHHYTRIVTIVMNKIYQVLFHPFVENLVVTIRYLGTLPFIKRFKHKHHTHFVTSSHQLRCRHIMRSTDSIYPHIFHDTDLATDSRIVHSCTERTKVVVITYTLELSQLTIEEETLFRDDFESTDTETSGVFIHKSIAFVYLRNSSIKMRIFHTPQGRITNHKVLHKQGFI